jgi:ribulose-5-phosphate 4-epimerase/fuculose-1-phosphate aldolase
VDDAGQQISGNRASKTLTLHRRIYTATAQTSLPASCVIHTHSTHCVALSLRADLHPRHPLTGEAELLPPLTPYFVMKVGHVPLTGYHFPGSAAAADRTTALIEAYTAAGSPIHAVMLNRLGPNVWGPTPAVAMSLLEELEETARLRLLASEATPLGAQDLADLRQQFAAHW